MNPSEITTFLESFSQRQARTIVIIDFANVEKWKHNLGWQIGIQELARLVKNFSQGNIELRRFYYGSDYGPKERSPTLSQWSDGILNRAKMNRFKVITKPVKYIHDLRGRGGYEKKCDLDVEITVDMIRMRDTYDDIVLFSGDGDIVYALQYLQNEFGKSSYVFGARGHVGREVVDATKDGVIQRLLYADDFRYRLDMDRFRQQ